MWIRSKNYNIRKLGEDDIDAIVELWRNASAQTMKNELRTKGERDDGLSLDRWGPGIATMWRGNHWQATVPAPIEPRVAIESYLTKLVGTPNADGLVALPAKAPDVVGFISYAVISHPILPGLKGSIDELHIERRLLCDYERVAAALIRAATDELYDKEVTMIDYHMPQTVNSTRILKGFKAAEWEVAGQWLATWE